MKMNRWLVIAGVAGVLCLFIGKGLSQNDPRPGNFGGANFDPSQIQKFLMDGYRGQLEITDDAEWKVIEERIQKVLDARRDTAFGGVGMMGRMFRRGGSASAATDRGPTGGVPRGLGAFAPAPNPEEEALQKSIDSKAPTPELKAKLAKVLDARKARQSNLEKAQADLRQVLSVRQEAIATLSGLL